METQILIDPNSSAMVTLTMHAEVTQFARSSTGSERL